MKSFKVMAATAVLALGGAMVMNANAESDRMVGFPTVGNQADAANGNACNVWNPVTGTYTNTTGTGLCQINNAAITLTSTAKSICDSISNGMGVGSALNCR